MSPETYRDRHGIHLPDTEGVSLRERVARAIAASEGYDVDVWRHLASDLRATFEHHADAALSVVAPEFQRKDDLVAELRKHVESRDKAIERWRSALSNEHAALEKSETQLANMTKQRDEFKKIAATDSNRLHRIEQEYARLQDKRDAAIRRAESAEAELERVNQELRAHGIEHPLDAHGVHDLRGFDIREELASVEAERDDVREELASAEAALDAVRRRAESAETERDTAIRRAEEAEADEVDRGRPLVTIDRLTEQLDDMRAKRDRLAERLSEIAVLANADAPADDSSEGEKPPAYSMFDPDDAAKYFPAPENESPPYEYRPLPTSPLYREGDLVRLVGGTGYTGRVGRVVAVDHDSIDVRIVDGSLVGRAVEVTESDGSVFRVDLSTLRPVGGEG